MALSRSELKVELLVPLIEAFPDKTKKELEAIVDDQCDRLVAEFGGDVYNDDDDDEEVDEEALDKRLLKYAGDDEEDE